MKAKLVGFFATVCAAALSVFAGYTRMDFITCNGTTVGNSRACTWVNTGYKPACTDRIEMKVRFTNYSATQNLFCSRDGSGNNSVTAFFIDNSGYKIRFDRGASGKYTFSSKTFTSSADGSTDYVITYDGNVKKGYVGTAETALDTTASTYTPGSALLLFASHWTTSITDTMQVGNQARYRFYYCRIYNSAGKLLHNYVPARDDSATAGSAAQYGVYDTVADKFLKNNGTNAFKVDGATALGTLGAAVTPTRAIGVSGHGTADNLCTTTLTFANAGFAQHLYCAWSATAPGGDTTNSWDHVEQLADVSATETSRTVTAPATAKYARYFLTPAIPGATAVATLNSSGANEYIDTGFTPKSTSRADYTFTLPSSANYEFASPFGSRNANTLQFFVGASKAGNYWFRRYGTNCVDVGYIANPSCVGSHTFSLDHNQYTLDGASLTMTRQDFTCACPAYVFAVNNNGTAAQFAQIALSSLAIWDDGALVRNYVPCVQEDGTPALYDAVNDTFATNAGTTALTTGAVIWTQTDVIPVGLDLAVTAAWSGAGDGKSVTDGANWCCTNLVGAALANTTLPTTLTACYVAGNVAFDCPTAFTRGSLAFGPVTLTADCDWRGLGALNLTSRIDVAGHTLRVADLSGTGAAEITDGTGFTDLATIQAINNHHFITDYTPACTDRIETEVYMTSSAATYNIWCCRGATTTTDTMTCFSIGGVFRFDRNWSSGVNATNTPALNTWVRIVADYNTCKVTLNDAEACTMAGGSFTPGSKLCLFASHTAGETNGVNNYWTTGYMRSFRVYAADGTLKLDLVPRMRNLDSVAGLYDRVSGAFYTSVTGADVRPGAVTATDGTGTLRVEVPAGTTCTNSAVLLSGGLAVVKEGAGTLLQQRMWNNFARGFHLAAGRVELPAGANKDAVTYCETNRLLGGYGTPFVADAGTTFDGKGNYDFYYHPMTLAGTLANSGVVMREDYSGYAIDALAGDATIDADYTVVLGCGNRRFTDLNGYTLTLDVVSGNAVYLTPTWDTSCTFTNGTINLLNGGWCKIVAPCEMRTVDIVQNAAALSVAATTSVRDFTANYPYNNNGGTADLNVYGTFTPNTDYFYGATLQDGASIDLSARTSTWSTTSAFTIGRNTVTFAKDATITVKLGTRTPTVGEKIIAWTSLPDATFAWDDPTTHTAAAIVAADGLYYGADPNSTVVERAVWTGAANDGNLRNPANWSCANLAGTALTDALPAATSTIALGANTVFNFTSAEWLPFVTNPSDAETKSATVCARIAGPLTGVNTGSDPYAFLYYPLDDYVYLGATPLTQLRDTTWTAANLSNSQLRFEGWFKVTDEQAGTWTVRTGADDYIAVAFDGTWIATNNLYSTVLTFTTSVTAGWHRFTVVRGDTGGGYSAKVTVGGQGTVLGVKINDSTTEVAFEDAFTFGSGEVFGWRTFDARGCTLAADCNWCALASLPIAETLDLNGHTLRVNSLATGTGVVTNSSETLGTLAVGVPALDTAANSTLTLAGKTRLLKDGAGTYKMTKTGQLFTGGIDVAAGTLQPDANGTSHPLGAAGGEVRVAEGATLDLLGYGNFQDYSLRLAGGSVLSSVKGASTQTGFARVTLDADSTVGNTLTMVLVGGTNVRGLVDLNGYTLTTAVKTQNTLFFNNTVITNGTMTSSQQCGWMYFAPLACDLSTVNLHHEGQALCLAGATPVRNYTENYFQNATAGSGRFDVSGTFRPMTNYFESVAMLDGSTLDLTALPGVFSLTSSSTGRSCSFNQGAHITVDCHGRTLALGQQLISWPTTSEWMGVRFALDAASAAAVGTTALTAKSDGLYVGGGLTWKGGDGALDDLANWQDAAGAAPTTLEGETLTVNGNVSFTSAYKFRAVMAHLQINGTATFTSEGGCCLGTLDLAENARLVVDPLAYTLRFLGAPSFGAGAKIALASKYAAKTKGRFLVMSWSAGSLDAATLANLFDTTSTAAGAAATLTEEVTAAGLHYLWLDLAPTETKPVLNVLVIGDRVARGETGCGNFRIPFVKELAADGYDVRTKGFWSAYSVDLSDMTMPDVWSRHSGDSLYTFNSTTDYPGYSGTIGNILEQAGDVDFVVNAVGENDLFGDTSKTGPQLADDWVAFTTRILALKPHAKVLGFNMLDRADKVEEIRTCNETLVERMAADVFPANRVYLVDVFTAAPRLSAAGADAGNWYDSAMPSRKGMAKIGAALAAVARQALAADATWQTGAAETPVVSSGAEANVPAAERAGFTLARGYDVAAHSGGKLIAAGMTYDTEGAGVVTNIGRVAWYIELKRPNGSTRWLWAAADAWGAKSIDQVGVPVRTGFGSQRVVTRLRVKTNMPGIDETADGAYDRGAVEFSRASYESVAPANSTLPTPGYAYDWNDTFTSSEYGSMQLHRFTTQGTSAGEVLFAFNGWTTGRTWEIGLGNFANYTLGSTDWTFSGSKNTQIIATMSAAAYEVARIEIWTMPETERSETIEQALWTGAAGTTDLTDPANWSCTNSAGAYVANAVPDAGTTVRLESGALAFVPPATSYAALTLGNCTLAADVDLRGAGTVRVEGTVNLAGHKLYLDQLQGAGTITDNTVFDLTTTDTSKVTSTTKFFGGVGSNLFNDNYARNGTDNTKRIIVEKTNLPLIVDYDFGTATTIDAYRMWTGPDANARCPSAWTFEGSDDGTTWTVLDRREKVGWQTWSWGRIFSLEQPATYRKYRMQVTDCWDTGYLEMVQLEYGNQNRLGELHLDVPQGETVSGSTVAITGTVRVFKDGKGSYELNKQGQSNWSFTLTGGLAKATQKGTTCQLGRAGAEVTILPGAIFEIGGKIDFDYYSFHLAGGRLQNAYGLSKSYYYATIKYIYLTADSDMYFYNGGLVGMDAKVTSIDLRGHTLLMHSWNFCYFVNTYVTDGTLKLVGNWEVNKTGFWSQARTEIYGRLEPAAAISVANYIDYATTTSFYGYNAQMTVTQSFQPNTAYFYGCTLADGATLDLSTQTGTWTTTSSLANTSRTTVTFADSGTFTVDVHGRRFKKATKILGWTTQPSNWDGLTFTLDAASRAQGYYLKKADDGLYVKFNATIIFVR